MSVQYPNNGGGGGGGTVTSVSVVTANGVSGSVANPTTTPAITLTLGAITPTTVNGAAITSVGVATNYLDATGNYSVPVGGGSGANTALSNLASVAINTALLPGSSTIDLGASTNPFQSLYLNNTSMINATGGVLPTLPSNSLFTVASSNSRVTILTIANPAFLTSARMNGTVVTPTAVQANDQIGGMNSYGYGTSGFIGPSTSVRSFAAENFATNFGSYLEFATTTNGTTTLTNRMRVENDGGVTIPSSVTGGSKGSGTLNATGLYVAGVAATVTIASGTATLGTSAIASGAKASTVTVTATGTATTDDIIADFNADPSAVTGYAPTVNGMLTIIKFPTANAVNFIVVNNTGASITPGAITLNWRVVR